MGTEAAGFLGAQAIQIFLDFALKIGDNLFVIRP
jgi:hypothetical protein